MNAAARLAIAKAKLGDKNPMWRGDKVGIAAIHDYIRRRKSKPAQCELCKRVTSSLDLANIHPAGKYTRNSSMYKYIWRLCHMIQDGRINRFYNSDLQRELQRAQVKARAISKTRIIKETCD